MIRRMGVTATRIVVEISVAFADIALLRNAPSACAVV